MKTLHTPNNTLFVSDVGWNNALNYVNKTFLPVYEDSFWSGVGCVICFKDQCNLISFELSRATL